MNDYNENTCSLSDEYLVELVNSGDEMAFNQLYFRYINLIRYKAASFQSECSLELDDLLQEGLMGLLSAVRNYKNSGGARFKTYLSVCINRRLLNAYKLASRKKHIPLNDYISLDVEEDIIVSNLHDPEFMFIEKEDKINRDYFIKNMLSKLEFKVLSLYMDEKNYNQIAQKLCITTKTVDNALQRIRKKLRNQIS